MIIDEDVYLEHFGTKGMKWGVRRERRLQALQRAGTKGGPLASKVRVITPRFGNLGPIDFLRGRGITGGSARKAKRLSGQLTRFKTGHATVPDLVKRYSSTRVSDLIPVRSKNAKKKTTVRADYAALGVVGGLFAARVIARQMAKKA
jgi:hypothetical protein